MASGEFDPQLDSLLSDLAVPVDLLPRLYGIAALGDGELDYRLCEVSLAVGLVGRLACLVSDEALDEQIRAVQIPVGVLARSRIVPLRRQRSLVRQWAVAASLMLIVGAGTLALVGSMVSLVRPVLPPPLAMVVIDQGPLDLVSPLDSAAIVVRDTPASESRSAAPGFSDETMAMLTTFDRSPLGPAGQLAADIHTVWNPWDNWLLMRWGALGFAPAGGRVLPELTVLHAPVAQGLEAPLVRGYDREFLYAHAVQPPTLTAFDAEARALDVPLVTQTESFDLALRLAAAGRVPTREQVRVEHFISAVQPPQLVEAERGGLAICTAAGPSVFNPSAGGLLQVGVQAGMHRRRSLPATHLVLAIDASAGMSGSGGLDLARRAVTDAVRYLGAEDRLSLLVFADEAVEIVREVAGGDRAALDETLSVLEQVTAGGAANLGAGLQQAVTVASESESSVHLPRRCVLMTASQPWLADKDAEAIRQMFTEAAKGDFRFEVCNLAPGDDAAAAWQALAGPLGCAVHRVHSAAELCWALFETITGEASLAATDVKLRVDFNPKAVAAYRLIGHDSTTVGGLLPASAETELHFGQGASALFEVWLYPNEADDVAIVGVQWRDPADRGPRQSGQQRVSRLQFAPAFEGMALSLQAAAIAAEGAEVLKQSFNFDLVAPDRYRYEPKPAGLDRVVVRADRAGAALAKEPRFRRVVDLFQTLSRLASERGSASARTGTRGMIADQWREYGSR